MHLDKAQKDALIELVRRAGREEIMPRFRKLDDGAIRSKSVPDDLVTDADIGSEHLIAIGAREILTEPLIVGEEAVAINPSVLDEIATSDWSVIIDPVDGTWNFANGLTIFGVILAVAYKGETLFGLLYDPVMDDWIMAEKGAGAFYCRPSGEKEAIRVSEQKPLESSVGLVPLFLFPATRRNQLAGQFTQFGRVNSYRCSCHEYRLLAQGKVDFILNGAMNPWDHAAGILIVEEAGGVAACLDGTPYSASRYKGYSLVANNEHSLNALFDKFSWLLEPD